MDRRRFLGALAGGLAGAMLPRAARADERPNVLIILADDMGFSDAGCYGGEIHTPNLDRLAAGGIRFVEHYSTGRCWPSRASLMTGFYAQQVRRDTMRDLKLGNRPKWAPLLPAMLAPEGYRCYHSGKWHIDGWPLRNGFHRSYRVDDQDRHFSPTRHWLDDEPLPQPDPVANGYYATRRIVDHAVQCLQDHERDHADEPFFHYLAFTVPHFPVMALQRDIARYREAYLEGWDTMRHRRHRRMLRMGIVDCALSDREPETVPAWNLSPEELAARIGPGEEGHAVPWYALSREQREFQATKMAIHAAMIDRMDREIGRVLGQLEAMGALGNTAIFFGSDNGASAEQMIRGDEHNREAPPGSYQSFLCLGPGFSTAANTPLRLHKSWVHEGGIASPMIVHWPEGLAARGELRHDPGHFVDIPPTVMELAGVPWPEEWDGATVPDRPGRSLVPAFERDNSVTHDSLWWHHIGHRALRAGDWKLVAQADAPWELYNLREDRSETRNLAASEPAKAQELAAKWEQLADRAYELATRE